MIPNKPPVRRRHKNKWTEADPSEVEQLCKFIRFDKNIVVLEEQANNYLAE
jgi:hypothetical protein